MKDNTRNGVMRITSTPDGQAPLRIREQWIGVEIPFNELRPAGIVRGVVTGELKRAGNCFFVDQVKAIAALQKKSPEAVEYWEAMGYPVDGAEWAFNAECAEIIG